MARWAVQDDLELTVLGVGRLLVRTSGGSITVDRTDGPATCNVRRLSGEVVDVALDGGTLRIMHPGPRWDGGAPTGSGETADIRVRVPLGCEVDVESATANIRLSDGDTTTAWTPAHDAAARRIA